MNDNLLQRVEEVMREVDDYYISRDHARAAASLVLEEAAQMAEMRGAALHETRDPYVAVQVAMAQDIADAIMAMKE